MKSYFFNGRAGKEFQSCTQHCNMPAPEFVVKRILDRTQDRSYTYLVSNGYLIPDYYTSSISKEYTLLIANKSLSFRSLFRIRYTLMYFVRQQVIEPPTLPKSHCPSSFYLQPNLYLVLNLFQYFRNLMKYATAILIYAMEEIKYKFSEWD